MTPELKEACEMIAAIACYLTLVAFFIYFKVREKILEDRIEVLFEIILNEHKEDKEE